MEANYPPANRTAQWKPQLAGGGTFTHVEKLCLHTTETSGWPGYPSFAPHLTYDPWKHQWHQHMPLTRSATTLEDPSSTTLRENRDNVIQVEIVAYCDHSTSKKYGHDVDDVDDRAVQDLAALAAWLHKTAGLKLALAPKWLPYPKSAGNSAARMSERTFDGFRGIHGHEHASGNHHGDPGNPPWLTKMLAYAQQLIDPTPPAPEGFDMTAAKDVYKKTRIAQTIKPDTDTLVKISDKKGEETYVTVAQAPNSGVDVLGNIEIKTGDQAARVNVWWILQDTKTGQPDKTHHERFVTSDDVPAGETAYGITASYKGAISKPAAGYTRKLRLRVRTDVPITLVGCQVTGWEMPS